MEQIEKILEHIDLDNCICVEIADLDLLDREYPTESICEILLNVIVHRDYSFVMSATALISSLDNKLKLDNWWYDKRKIEA